MPVKTLTNIMRTDVSLPSDANFNAFIRWLSEGLAIATPQALKNIGWQANNTLIRLNDDHPDDRDLIEQSWLGERRVAAGDPASSLPVEIALSPEDIFITKLSLPAEASRTLKKTIALRLSEISPIPPESAAFAIGETARQNNGRLSVDVAITRKTTLNKTREDFSAHQIAAIGACPAPDGALQFIFDDEAKASKDANNAFLSGGLIAISFLALLVTANIHLERRLTALSDYETSILSELKSLRPAKALFANTDLEALASNHGAPSPLLFMELRNHLDGLPDGALIKTINLTPTKVELSGYAPETVSTDDVEFQSTKNSNYEGYIEFTYAQNLSNADE
ncbi:MAG: hypothetical protein DHS20C05_16710 [Hyphococcus sp.]|nr:MAG: hypothetical protein DHS20C05_16710 [Marinicaulis sp.]